MNAPATVTIVKTALTIPVPADPAPPTGGAPDLAYAPVRPGARRRRVVRRAVMLLFVTGIVLAGWRWGGAVVAHADLLLAQRRCAAHTFPVDVVLASSQIRPGMNG